MTKKTIIFVLIFLIVINTIYWISLIPKLWRRQTDFIINLVLFSGESGTYAIKNIIELLSITDIVLIAISFMIILLYKKSKILKKQKHIKKGDLNEKI